MKFNACHKMLLLALVAAGSLCATAAAGGPPPPWAKTWKSAPASGPLETAPPGAVIVKDHWHLKGDFGAVLHGERWGRAGRVGAWKVPVRPVLRRGK